MASQAQGGSLEPPELHAELLDIIVDYLHDDVDSLRCCSIASKRLLATTRYHLFFRLYINFGRSRKSFSDFSDLLESNTSVPQYIHELTLQTDDLAVLSSRLGCIVRPDMLALISNKCPNLQSLNLRSIIWDRSTIASSIQQHPPSFPGPFVRFVRPLESLSLEDPCNQDGQHELMDIVHILSCFTSVKSLHLDVKGMCSIPISVLPPLPSDFEVDSLTIEGPKPPDPSAYSLCRAIFATRTSHSLRRLHMLVRNAKYVGLLRDVIIAECTSLTEVTLDLQEYTMIYDLDHFPFPSLIDLPITSALLTYHPGWNPVLEEWLTWDLSALINVLVALPATISHLHIKAMFIPGRALAATYVATANWSAVRDRLRTFKKLKSVVFELDVRTFDSRGRKQSSIDGFMQDMTEIVMRELSDSVEAGSFEIINVD